MAIVIPNVLSAGAHGIGPANYATWFDTVNVCPGGPLFYSDDIVGQVRRAKITDGTRTYEANGCVVNGFSGYMWRDRFGQQGIDIWKMRRAGLWTTSIQFTHSIVLKNNVYVDGGGRNSFFCAIYRLDNSAQIGATIYDEFVAGIGSNPTCVTAFTNSYSVTFYADGSYTLP